MLQRVIDSNGYTASVKTLDLNVTSLQSIGVGNTWTAESAGNYTAKAFIVSRGNVPSLLARPQMTSIAIAG